MTETELRDLILTTMLKSYNTPGLKIGDAIYDAFAPLLVED